MPHEYLLFRLRGPLSAWGEIAVGEQRSSWPRPSKSAILGLAAAALGYDRHDAAAHTALNDGLHFAVRVDTLMRASENAPALKPLRDYHTAQVPSARRGKRWATRAQELAEDELNTILSERWYWIDMTATVALWPSGRAAAPPLVEIAAALREPAFALYLGRKACPLGRPLSPAVLAADSFSAAFRSFDSADAASIAQVVTGKGKKWRDAIFMAFATAAGEEIWADIDAIPEERRDIVYSRRDAIRDRRNWTFSDRTEARLESGGDDVSVAR